MLVRENAKRAIIKIMMIQLENFNCVYKKEVSLKLKEKVQGIA